VVTVGDTDNGLEVLPVDHEYNVAPAAVSEALWPLHIVGEFTVTVGSAFTVTVAIAVPVQPEVFPVTVYEVVVPGETLIGFVVAPVDHVYAVAPLAIRVAEEPLQITGEFTVTAGPGFTVTVETAVEEQPLLVPVTVYVVVEDGETLMGFVVAPVDHV
jgi:hypothetical protein